MSLSFYLIHLPATLIRTPVHLLILNKTTKNAGTCDLYGMAVGTRPGFVRVFRNCCLDLNANGAREGGLPCM